MKSRMAGEQSIGGGLGGEGETGKEGILYIIKPRRGEGEGRGRKRKRGKDMIDGDTNKRKDKDKGKSQAEPSSSSSSSSSCWSSALPNDILSSILSRLPLPDYFHSGAVCKSWHSVLAANPIPRHLSQPLLMVPRITPNANNHEQTTQGSDSDSVGICSLYSLSHPLEEQCRININLPFGRWTRCVSSSNGWLMVADRLGNLHMLDPISGTHIPLPPVTTFTSVDPIYSTDGNATDITGYAFTIYPEEASSVEYTMPYFCEIFFHKAIIGWTQDSSPTYTVMAIFGGEARFLAFARQGDTAWTPLQCLHPQIEYADLFDDVIYHKSRFYALANGRVIAYDLSGPAPVDTMVTMDSNEEFGNYNNYLVEVSDELFLILRILDDVGNLFQTVAFRVYKLLYGDGCGGEGSKWVQVQRLGDHSLFLGTNNSLSLSVQGYPGVKGNSIYFTDDYLEKQDVGVFDIASGTITSYYPRECKSTRLQPIWFLPNLSNHYSGNTKCMNKQAINHALVNQSR